ncbi:polygalacturonase inhibitor [Nicotiana tabacum]|uniref:Polygalacturonase inhibitor n=1 Tax=Nicotiana tabacum TaxID=4097 RepID=A0A1S4ADC2_TOBAC|nr:polygalacturonase inhibitor-like [Nicotiana tomentosiformis]XP_016474670.1 PREDICTED: polygalacturonase inhibitor-like [Nicotiana tabacum]
MKPYVVSILSFSLLFLSLAPPTLSERCNPNDKQALLEIKKGLGNPYDLITWDPKTDCCDDWAQSTLSCDDETNRVTSLTLFKIDDAGHLSPTVGDLPYLQSLDITKVGNLSGPIPATIAHLTYLIFLRITKTNISGPVPEFLGKLKNLTYINLSDNNLEGSIPPSLSQLSNLSYLRLDRNKLTGTIPESFGNFAPKLEFLYLGQNKLSGVVPRSFAGWSFETLDLSGNKLEGDISFLFGNDSNTFQLYLSRNKFEFDFSKLKFGKKLVSLVLNHNNIYGRFPAGFAKRPWQEFNVSYNSLCGKIPQGGYMIRFDLYSYIHNKCLCDFPLPPCKL